MLLHQNQNIVGLKRNSQLINKTPLMLGRGVSQFVPLSEAEALFATIGNKLRKSEEQETIKMHVKERLKMKKLVKKYNDVAAHNRGRRRKETKKGRGFKELYSRPKNTPLPLPYYWFHDVRDLKVKEAYMGSGSTVPKTLRTLDEWEEEKQEEKETLTTSTKQPHDHQPSERISIGHRVFHTEKRAFGNITTIELGPPTTVTRVMAATPAVDTSSASSASSSSSSSTAVVDLTNDSSSSSSASTASTSLASGNSVLVPHNVTTAPRTQTITVYRKKRYAAKTDSGVTIALSGHHLWVDATHTFEVALSRETEMDTFGITLEQHPFPFVPTHVDGGNNNNHTKNTEVVKEKWHDKNKREKKGPKGIFVVQCEDTAPSLNYHFPETGRTQLHQTTNDYPSGYCAVVYINGMSVIPPTMSRAAQMLNKGGRLWSTLVLQTFPKL